MGYKRKSTKKEGSKSKKEDKKKQPEMHISPVTLNKIEISRNKVSVPEGVPRKTMFSLQENKYL
jgi:hypothetical protein